VTVVVEWTCMDKNGGAGKEDWPLIVFDFILGSLIAPLHCQFTNSFIFRRLCDSLTWAQVPFFDQSSISLKYENHQSIFIILIIYLHFRLEQSVLRHEHALSD